MSDDEVEELLQDNERLRAINAELRNGFEEIAEARFMEPNEALLRHVYTIVGRLTAKYPLTLKGE